jgi:tetratricopeptide (TPR) repeat protein
MIRVALALALLAITLAGSGDLASWISTWHATRGQNALERARSAGDATGEIERALRELGDALRANSLSRDYRGAFETAVEEALDQLAPQRVAALATGATLARAIAADALERRGAAAAAEALRAGIELARPEEIAVMNDAMLRAAALDMATAERCEQARPLLESASERIPEDSSVELKYAGCLNTLGEPQRALAVLRRMSERGPTSRWTRLYTADAYRRLGDLDQAERTARWITTGFADFYEGWRLEAEVLAAMGRPAEAAVCYRKALALRPENTWLDYYARKMDKRAATATPPSCQTPQAGGCP